MKTTAILIPSYKRFNDLVNTLQNTPIDARAKFIIVANLEDNELAHITQNYGDKSIITDERQYGKLGGCRAYNLAFKIAKEHNFDYAVLYADDIIPFKSSWLDKLYKEFIDTNAVLGIFSSDECHPGYYGWNIILDCPIAHFFIIDCKAVEQLFSEDYKQYAIDFEIAVRLKEQGTDIQLLPIRLNHLRSGLHREFMDKHMNDDINLLISNHPKYATSFRQNQDLHFLKQSNKSVFVSEIEVKNLPLWTELQPKVTLKNNLKRFIKSTFKNTLHSFGYGIHKNQTPDPEAIELTEFLNQKAWLKAFNINTVLDIGANEGQFAKKITALLPAAEVHCFEPLKKPFNKLKETFQHKENIFLNQFALGDSEEELTINLNEYSPSSSFLEMQDDHKKNFDYAIATTKSKVQVKRLDSLHLKLTQPILIKIDVQGFEDRVIAGGLDVVKKAHIIIVEVSFKVLYEGQPLFNDIYNSLFKLGFRYHGNFEQLTSPVSGEILQADAIFINNSINK